jgi:ferrous iron transport protein B
VIELPPYRFPQAKTLWLSTWDKGKGFVKKAETIIFAGSVLIWLLSYAGPGGMEVNMDESYLLMIGGVLAPIFEPLGFGTWQAGASLLTGFLAKEAIISTFTSFQTRPHYRVCLHNSIPRLWLIVYPPVYSLHGNRRHHL